MDRKYLGNNFKYILRKKKKVSFYFGLEVEVFNGSLCGKKCFLMRDG